MVKPKTWGYFGKKLRTINQQTYCERIVPIIYGWIWMNFYLFLMQNGIPKHAAKIVIQKISKRNIRVIRWFAFNPNFNLIGTVWNNMKDWIQKIHLEILNYE